MTLLQQETYEPLTEESAIQLAKKLNIFNQEANLVCQEIGDGNLNYVFHITDRQNGQSLIIKQALPYAKVVGESWPLSLNRATIEAEALKLFKSLTPNFIPEVYYTNEALAITVMEDLSHLTIARSGLIQGENYPHLANHLGTFLANSLFFTSDYGLNPIKKKELVAKFINPDLCKITEDLIFTDPFYDTPTNEFEEELKDDTQELWEDEPLKLQVALLKKKFLTETEALLHGDLHTGSIFASYEETKIIDPEFAYFGPAGFDLGQVIANLLFQAIACEQKKEKIFAEIEQFWNVFQEKFTHLWNTQSIEPYRHLNGFLQQLIQKYFKDAIGFAGCEIIRRTIGLAHVADLDSIETLESKLVAKRRALETGRKLILNHQQYLSIKDVFKDIL